MWSLHLGSPARSPTDDVCMGDSCGCAHGALAGAGGRAANSWRRAVRETGPRAQASPHWGLDLLVALCLLEACAVYTSKSMCSGGSPGMGALGPQGPQGPQAACHREAQPGFSGLARVFYNHNLRFLCPHSGP